MNLFGSFIITETKGVFVFSSNKNRLGAFSYAMTVPNYEVWPESPNLYLPRLVVHT